MTSGGLPELLKILGLTPASEGVTWTWTPTGPPRCPDCGARVSVSMDLKSGNVGVIRVTHPTPICPQFARAVEEQP